MKRILLIEDNEDIRLNTAEILELANYEVRLAENGVKGVEAALDFHPDLIICDIMMPELDGFGVLDVLQKKGMIKNTPFIFLTARTERGDFRRGMESGADDYITKPFGGDELLNAIESRLKKIETLKEEVLFGLDGLAHLVKITSGHNAWLNFTNDLHIQKFKRNHRLFQQGHHATKLYYVLSGKIKTFRIQDNGIEQLTNMYYPGDFLGHIPLLEGAMYWDNAETLEESELVTIPKEDFDALIYHNSEVAKKFIQILAKNISIQEDQLLAMAKHALLKKVAETLLIIHGNHHLQHQLIDIQHDILSEFTVSTTEAFLRALGDLRAENIIEILDGKILIKDQQKLEEVAQ